MKSRRTLIISVGAIALVGAAALAVRYRGVPDSAIHESLIGSWKAVDLDNASIHHKKVGVAAEEVTFKADGTLTYRVQPKPGQGETQIDPYSWKVEKGKLNLRYLGEGSAGDLLPKLRIAVDDRRLSMARRGYPDKVFERVKP